MINIKRKKLKALENNLKYRLAEMEVAVEQANERRLQLKCFWTYPWGHVLDEDNFVRYDIKRCAVCDVWMPNG